MTAKFLACALAMSLFVSAASADTIQEFTSVLGNNTFAPGQSVTTGAGIGWNNLEFNWFNANHGATAFGTLYLLDQEYLGAPSGLTGATAGFIASSTGILNDRYVFDPSVAISSNTKYWFYTDAILATAGDSGYLGGNIYVNFPLADIDANFIPTTFDAAFRLSGDPVPEPSTLALLGLGAALVVARRRRKKTA